MTTDEKVVSFIRDKAINVSALAEKMNMPYQTAYDTFSGKGKRRKIKANELLQFCSIYEINPMLFRND